MTRRNALNVAVVGATGAVGSAMLRVLEERRFPIKRLVPLASARSRGKRLHFHGQSYRVEPLSAQAFDGIDLALFSAGALRSLEFAPAAARRGAVVVDNSSAFRMDPDVPLVVPEVNPQALASHNGIIANPNCSTIILVMALKPLHDAAHLRRVVVTTFQSVSGAGAKAMYQLITETTALVQRLRLTRGGDVARKLVGFHPHVQGRATRVLPAQIAWNIIPQIGSFADEDYTQEEWKMVHETRRILSEPTLPVVATCVRVPVLIGHAESVVVECARAISPAQARELLRKAPGLRVVDDPPRGKYPLPIDVASRDEVFVGRIRRDPSTANGLALWVVGDNLRKGAATNAVQIAELIAHKGA